MITAYVLFALASLAAGYGFATMLVPDDSNQSVSVRSGQRAKTRGWHVQKNPGKPMVWAYVGRGFTINRGRFFGI